MGTYETNLCELPLIVDSENYPVFVPCNAANVGSVAPDKPQDLRQQTPPNCIAPHSAFGTADPRGRYLVGSDKSDSAVQHHCSADMCRPPDPDIEFAQPYVHCGSTARIAYRETLVASYHRGQPVAGAGRISHFER